MDALGSAVANGGGGTGKGVEELVRLCAGAPSKRGALARSHHFLRRRRKLPGPNPWMPSAIFGTYASYSLPVDVTSQQDLHPVFVYLWAPPDPPIAAALSLHSARSTRPNMSNLGPGRAPGLLRHLRTSTAPASRTAACAALGGRRGASRLMSTEKQAPDGKGSFKGQMLESITTRIAREKEERERIARERITSSSTRNAATTFSKQASRSSIHSQSWLWLILGASQWSSSSGLLATGWERNILTM